LLINTADSFVRFSISSQLPQNPSPNNSHLTDPTLPLMLKTQHQVFRNWVNYLESTWAVPSWLLKPWKVSKLLITTSIPKCKRLGLVHSMAI
jgi:hypothetical protein